MTPRYLFALPDMIRPVGGMNIQYLIMETLREAGYRVAALHAGRHYRYPFADPEAEVCVLPALADALQGGHALQGGLVRRIRKEGLWTYWQDRAARRAATSATAHPRLEPGPQDVFVLPDFAYSRYAPLFPDAAMVLAVQDVFGLARSFARDAAASDATAGGPPQHRRFRAVYTTSEVSAAAVRALLGRESHRIGLPVDAGSLQPLPKTFRIAYMPRKRKEESALVLAALRARMGAEMPPVVPIANMSDEARNKVLRESLFFLSFSQMEGFGLPPAEAMAAGCIVVGYTGVGGNEYFTARTGFPVEDSDIIGFVGTVERLVRAYRTDPAPLDALRLAASDHIRTAHDPAVWRARLLAAWAEIDRGIRGGCP